MDMHVPMHLDPISAMEMKKDREKSTVRCHFHVECHGNVEKRGLIDEKKAKKPMWW